MMPASSYGGVLPRIFYSLLGSDPNVVPLLAWREQCVRTSFGIFLLVTSSLAGVSGYVLMNDIKVKSDSFNPVGFMFPIVLCLFVFSVDRLAIAVKEITKGYLAMRLVISLVIALFVGSSLAVWAFSETIARYNLEQSGKGASVVGVDGMQSGDVTDGESKAGSTSGNGGMDDVTQPTDDSSLRGGLNRTALSEEIANLRAALKELETQKERYEAEKEKMDNLSRSADQLDKDFASIICSLSIMKVELERGTSGGFPCEEYRNIVGKGLDPSAQGGVGGNYRSLRDAVQEKFEELSKSFDGVDNFIGPEVSLRIQDVVTRIRSVEEKERGSWGSEMDSIVSETGQIKNELKEIVDGAKGDIGKKQSSIDEVDKTIEEMSEGIGKKENLLIKIDDILVGKEKSELDKEKSKIAQERRLQSLSDSDVLVLYVGMFKMMLDREYIGHTFHIVIFLAVLLMMDMSVILAKMSLRTTGYDELCEEIEKAKMDSAKEILKKHKIMESPDSDGGWSVWKWLSTKFHKDKRPGQSNKKGGSSHIAPEYPVDA